MLIALLPYQAADKQDAGPIDGTECSTAVELAGEDLEDDQ